jgi:hypothetical protein
LERFQSLVSELTSPKIQINSGEAAHKATRHFTASIATAYMLSKGVPAETNAQQQKNGGFVVVRAEKLY